MTRLLILLACLLTPAATAHDLARDGQIGALLHLAPDDAPVAGQRTDLHLNLRYLGGPAITLTACDCRLTVLGAGIRLNVPLTSEPGGIGAAVVFPNAGAYTLTLRGTVRGQTFTLSWPIRADR